MGTATDLVNDFNSFVDSEGSLIRFRYFTGSVQDDEYDDGQTLTQSGTDLWTSGVLLPLNSAEASTDAFKIEQGNVITANSKLFVKGTVQTSGMWRVGVGSPVGREYATINNGVFQYAPDGSIVYKKLFLQFLTTGSLDGE